jgi:hypothetical protein
MNKTTRRDVEELLGCIKQMNDSFKESNRAEINADEDAKRAKYLAFCKAMGMVTGQASVVQIDLEVYEDEREEEELIPCEMCVHGQWEAECCNGSGGCDCHGQPVQMGARHVCNGTGMRRKDADKMANANSIRNSGRCFLGSGPTSGYWAGK